VTQVSVAVVGAHRAALDFIDASRENDAKLRALVRHHGHLLRTAVMRNASGRPGPNVITGDYRRSITVQFYEGDGNFVATVGTNLPQGRRLEFGFHGADSLGRVYNQPPYPHFGPAMDTIGPDFNSGIAALVEEI